MNTTILFVFSASLIGGILGALMTIGKQVKRIANAMENSPVFEKRTKYGMKIDY